MTISIGADHGGSALRAILIAHLGTLNHQVIDHGTDGIDSVDYPDYSGKVCRDITEGRADLGILVCTSGIGMSIAANKVPGIRAALVTNEEASRLSREHNNANVICLGQNHIPAHLAKIFVTNFTTTDFAGDGTRHERRVKKIAAEEQHFCSK